MYIFFPHMHPGPVVAGLPDLRYFDPGYEDQPAPESYRGVFRPQGLPLDPAAARRLVADAVNYGQQFKTPGEMAWHGLQPDGAKPETERVIKAELLARLDGTGPESVDPAQAQAQFVLLLAWKREADLADQASLEARLTEGRQRFESGLGVDGGEAGDAGEDDDPDQKALSLVTAGLGELADEDETAVSWRPLLAAMARFLPSDAVLVCAHPEIIAAWREAGLEFVPAGNGLPAGAERGKAPLGLLVGSGLAGVLGGELAGRELSVLCLPV